MQITLTQPNANQTSHTEIGQKYTAGNGQNKKYNCADMHMIYECTVNYTQGKPLSMQKRKNHGQGKNPKERFTTSLQNKSI